MHSDAESPQVRRVQQWIERLEDKAVELLDGLVVEEMTPKHQADVALKCLDHLQRFTAIEKKLQDASQTNDKQGLLSKFMREARGEQESSEERKSEQVEREQDRQVENHEDLWQWLEDKEKEWQENNWTEDEEWQEEESWLEQAWWLEEELPWEGC